MRVMFLLAAFAAVLSAQASVAAKPEAPPAKEAVAPSERSLTEVEVLKFQNAVKDIVILREKFKIDDFQKQAATFSQIQQGIYRTACASIGIAPQDIEKTCGFDPAVDGNGVQVNGPDGKPQAARVWRIMPPAPEPPPTAKK